MQQQLSSVWLYEHVNRLITYVVVCGSWYMKYPCKPTVKYTQGRHKHKYGHWVRVIRAALSQYVGGILSRGHFVRFPCAWDVRRRRSRRRRGTFNSLRTNLVSTCTLASTFAQTRYLFQIKRGLPPFLWHDRRFGFFTYIWCVPRGMAYLHSIAPAAAEIRTIYVELVKNNNNIQFCQLIRSTIQKE